MRYFVFLCVFLGFCQFSFAKPHHAVCMIRVEPTIEGGGGTGTGFFIENDVILTAYHVVAKAVELNRRVRVDYKDHIYPAKVIAKLPTKDLALLQVKVDGEEFIRISLDKPQDDDILRAVGHPKGVWKNHTSKGTLVKIKRGTSIDENGRFSNLEEYITRMDIRKGMSGGPLLNEDGDFIGVVRAKSTSGPKRGFFITSKEVEKFLKEQWLKQ